MTLDLKRLMKEGGVTRDGRKVTVYCVNATSKFPIHGHVEGDESPCCWRFDGLSAFPTGGNRLLNLPSQPREWWLIPNNAGAYEVYDTYDEAVRQWPSHEPYTVHVREVMEESDD